VLLTRALLLAMLDRIDEAWSIALPAGERSREIGYGGDAKLAHLANLVGDHATADRYLKAFCDETEELGDIAVLSSYAPLRGRTLCALGRFEEAEALARQGRELGSPEDLYTEALWRQAQALVLSSRGEHAEAEQLAREAVTVAAETDMLELQGGTYVDLADVLDAAGRRDEAAASLREALDRYERKEIIPFARRAREKLATLATAPA
jgi:tetratricopeptide (TPR) repeat protein